MDLSRYGLALQTETLVRKIGRVFEINGPTVKATLPGASVGATVRIDGQSALLAEVIRVAKGSVTLMLLELATGIRVGDRVELVEPVPSVRMGSDMLGRVINAFGEPIDNLGESSSEQILLRLAQSPVNPLSRVPIREPIDVGVRAINACLTIGKGQRTGIFAGSGVGKSMLLGMIARSQIADVNVIALIGERGREVRDFIEEALGEEGLKKSVLIVATSDETPVVRKRAAHLANAIAEHFSSQGKDVLLLMDSITRMSHAQREMALSSGELPATRGYPASVFSTLPLIFERAGAFENKGSITGFYTVLVDGDDMNDPIADSVRSLVDGHIVLSRKIAQSGQYPAIDILQSASRLMNACTSPDHQAQARTLRRLLSTYYDAQDLIQIGAYQKGSSPEIDQSVSYFKRIQNFLAQNLEEPSPYQDSLRELKELLG